MAVDSHPRPTISGRIGLMRWTELFDDLEAQVAAQEEAERRGEVAEHTRDSWGRVALADRYLADLGRFVRVRVLGGVSLEGKLSELGHGWLVLADSAGARPRESLVVTANVLTVQGLSGRSDVGRPGRVQRTLGLRHILRALSRDRSTVRAHLVEGGILTGTIDRVGADHLDLGAHPADLPRRTREVHSVLTIPVASLAALIRDGD